MAFGDRLSKARADLGWTQPQLQDAIREASGKRFNPTPSEISRYEKGRVKNPSLEFIVACAAATGRSVEFFTDDAGREQQEASDEDEDADLAMLLARLIRHPEVRRALERVAA